MNENERNLLALALHSIEEAAEIVRRVLAEAGESEMMLYSQRDPRWRSQVYADSATFENAGCYVVCVAMIASLAGYEDEPPAVAQKLRDAKCFSGTLLNYPNRIPNAYPLLRWDGVIDWRTKPADIEKLRQELERGPVILEVDCHPGGTPPPTDQHFVIAEQFTVDGKDLMIADPWDGTRTRLLERYALASWDLARTVFGARLLRVK
jgi:hypothetical protein